MSPPRRRRPSPLHPPSRHCTLREQIFGDRTQTLVQRRRRLDQEDRMFQPRPTRAPAGRLLRLSLVLNPLAARDRLVEVARMGDRAGIGALWVSDVHPLDRRPATTDALLALSLLAPMVQRARGGVMLTPAPGSADDVARMTGTLQEELAGRLEVGLRLGRLGPIALEAYIAALRRQWSESDRPMPPVSLQTELGPARPGGSGGRRRRARGRDAGGHRGAGQGGQGGVRRLRPRPSDPRPRGRAAGLDRADDRRGLGPLGVR